MNLGNPVEYRVIDLARMVLSLSSSPSSIVFKPLPSDDPSRRKPDITKARAILGWEPRIPVEEGLLRTIKEFQDRLGRHGN